MCMYLLFSCSLVSDFLWPSGLQHTRLCSLLPSPGACSNSCPLSRWCHPTISSSVVVFSSCLKSFPPSGSFLMSQPFASSGQRIGASGQHQPFQWIFRIDFLYDRLIWSPCCPSNSQESSPAPQFKGMCVCVCMYLTSKGKCKWRAMGKYRDQNTKVVRATVVKINSYCCC